MRMLLAAAVAITFLRSPLLGYRQADPRSLPRETVAEKQAAYDGHWWLAASGDERSGFLDGSADCLEWVIHAKWFSRDLPDLEARIDRYYKVNETNRSMLVTAVWQRVLAQAPPTPPKRGGEVWNNPHGYYNGSWYRQGSHSQRLGYLQGYIGCLRTYVKQPKETYSRPPDYYDNHIWDYIEARKAYNEPVANILARYSDQLQPR